MGWNSATIFPSIVRTDLLYRMRTLLVYHLYVPAGDEDEVGYAVYTDDARAAVSPGLAVVQQPPQPPRLRRRIDAATPSSR